MKKILSFAISILMANASQADQVDVDKAKNVALQFMRPSVQAKSSTSVSTTGAELNLVYTATYDIEGVATRAASTANNLFYVFNQTDDGGFVIVAADDAVSPILAYSHENSFKADDMPCNVKAVLDTYRDAISSAIAAGNDASSEWSDIAAKAAEAAEGDYLVKSKWGQGYPYNTQTPMLAEEHCVTGCVATAMAQIIYYWKYPEVGHGSMEYSCSSIG